MRVHNTPIFLNNRNVEFVSISSSNYNSNKKGREASRNIVPLKMFNNVFPTSSVGGGSFPTREVSECITAVETGHLLH